MYVRICDLCLSVGMCACIYVCMQYMYACLRICMDGGCIHICMYVMYACMYVCVYEMYAIHVCM